MPNWSDFFPDAAYAGAFGTGTPQEEATRAPTPVDNAVGKAGKIAMIPGQAYNSQTPISTDQMVGPATDLASFVTLGSGAMPAEANALRMGIKAYHGSPHDFDRFDLSKIGTGEGAQAYGHGLYFAESPKVAQAYRENLTDGSTHVHFGDPSETFHPDELTGADSIAARGMLKYDSPSGVHKFIDQHAATDEEAAQAHKMVDEGIINKADPGRMYEVDINADPAHFLDWDQPLSKQSDSVKNVVSQLVKERGGSPDYWLQKLGENPDGRKIVSELGLGDTSGLSSRFREAGIPGIKYLDQGSRVPQTQIDAIKTALDRAKVKGDAGVIRNLEMQLKSLENPTHNYVVFDDNLIDILRKYGWAGIAALPALQSREERT